MSRHELPDLVESQSRLSAEFADCHGHELDKENYKSVSRLVRLPHDGFHSGHWATLPLGQRIFEALPWSKPLVIALGPEPDLASFRRKWGVDLQDMVRLVDAGLVLPSIYTWRHPESWMDADPGMAELLKRSIVTAHAAERFMDLGAETFDSTLKERRIYDAIRDLPDDEVITLAQDDVHTPPPRGTDAAQMLKFRKNLAVAWGARWAYVDRLVEPDLADQIDKSFNHQPAQYIRYIKLLKQINASPITAAVGGDYVWGKHELARARSGRWGESGKDIAIPNDRWANLPSNIRKTLGLLAMVPKNPAPDQREIDIDTVISIASDPDIAIKRERLVDTMHEIGGCWPFDRHENPEIIAHLLHQFVDDRNKIADRWAGCGWAGVLPAIGYIATGIPLTATLAFIGKPIELLAKPAQDRLRDTLLSMDPRHRLVLQASSITK